MIRLQRPDNRALFAGLAVALVCVSASWLLARSDQARAASSTQLQQQISAGQSRISSLSGAVGAASSQLSALNSSIAGLQGQIAVIQADLNQKRTELIRLRSQLNAARTRLAQLEAFEAHADTVLSQQLISSYEGDQPDLVTVVLEAQGFQDLLERLSFAQRIQKQDVQVVGQVRAARRAVAAQATRLGALEARQQTLTEQVLAQRNSVDRIRLRLVQQQLAVAQARNAKASQLAGARSQVASLQQQLSKAQAAQAAAAGGGAAIGGGSQVVSANGFAFPLPKSAASPPSTWSPDQGVDIAAPGNTPEYAVCSGTIVLHGIGGFGPWAPVLHCDSPLAGYDYVYYGHAGPENQLPVGTHVGAGQVMSSVGPGIVGISSGPHLEIGFADSSGSPVGPQSAGTMLSLLQASY
jgi:murein DD-endopeptidase MepM/ murein hydrolase activator NlpD